MASDLNDAIKYMYENKKYQKVQPHETIIHSIHFHH